MIENTLVGLTQKERIVLGCIAEACLDGYSAWISQDFKSTGLPISGIKGVIGSLVKKGVACTAGGRDVGGVGECHDIFLFINGHTVSHGNESGELSDGELSIANKIALNTKAA